MERHGRDVGESGGGGGGECLRHDATSAEIRRLCFTDGDYKVSVRPSSHERFFFPSALVSVHVAVFHSVGLKAWDI